METRGCVAEIDAIEGTIEYHAATQNSHVLKWSLGFFTGRQPVWRSIADMWQQRERMKQLGRNVSTFMKQHKDVVGRQHHGQGDGQGVPEGADAHRAPEPVDARPARQGPGDVAA